MTELPGNPLGRGPSEPPAHHCSDYCRLSCAHCGADLCGDATDFDDPQLALPHAATPGACELICQPCHAAIVATTEPEGDSHAE